MTGETENRRQTVNAALRIRIRELCEERGITVNHLSLICGITQSTLENIVGKRENGATVSTVKKICDGLEIRMYDFFNCPAFNDLKKQEPETNGYEYTSGASCRTPGALEKAGCGKGTLGTAGSCDSGAVALLRTAQSGYKRYCSPVDPAFRQLAGSV